jgi:RNA polymerase sigma factor (sigma-70 family)
MKDFPSGDLMAFTKANNLVEANLGLVRVAARWAKRRLPSHVEFHDLFQDGAVGLVEAATRYDADRGIPFPAFARKRVFGAIVDVFRGNRYGHYSLQPIRNPEAITSPSSAPRTADRDMRSILERIIPVLDGKQRTVVVLRYWSAESYSQIAERLRVRPDRAKRLDDKALVKLKEEFRRQIHIRVQGPGVMLSLL